MCIAFLFEIGISHVHKNMNVLNVIEFNTLKLGDLCYAYFVIENELTHTYTASS